MKSRRGFSRFAWAVLLYNIPVILWGAYVRISFSGDGCGADWPFCAGHMVPRNMARPMAIEYTHRMMTTLDLLLTGILLAWAFRAYPKAHAVRRYASWSAVFLFIEALLGAGLVLFRKVAHDQSAGRAVYLSAHLTNTMLLFGSPCDHGLAGPECDPENRVASYFGPKRRIAICHGGGERNRCSRRFRRYPVSRFLAGFRYAAGFLRWIEHAAALAAVPSRGGNRWSGLSALGRQPHCQTNR